MRFKIKEKTREQLWEDFEWLNHLSFMTIIFSFLWVLPFIDKQVFIDSLGRVYDSFLRIALKNPTTYKTIFFAILVLFAFYFVKMVFDLIVKIYFKVQQLKGGKKKK